MPFGTVSANADPHRLTRRTLAVCALVSSFIAGGCASSGNQQTSKSGGRSTPDLSAAVSSLGTFSPGQQNARYTITVFNASGAGATIGTVTVTGPPTGFSVSAVSGASWTCVLATLTCSNSTPLAGGQSYPAITVTGNVTANVGQDVGVPVRVSGGGASTTTKNKGSFTVAAVALSITIGHSGHLTAGEQGATYTVRVSNGANAGETSGTVTMIETVPSGLSLVSMAGTGWTCHVGRGTCTRGDLLIGGQSYPAIKETFDVLTSAPPSVTNRVSLSGGNSPSASASDVTTITPATTASLVPPSLSFGSQSVAMTSAAQTVTLTNTGSTSLSITGIAVTGANASDFGQTNTCGTSVAAGANCAISATFTPTGAGPRKSSIVVGSSGTSGNPPPIILTGVGSAAGLSPTSLTFGPQAVGTSSAVQVVTFTNKGSAAMNIWGIAILGANASDFSETTTCGSTLGGGASCTVGITFKPAATGSRSASLLFSDDGGGSPQSVSLTATGTVTAPAISSFTPTSGPAGTSVTLTGTGFTGASGVSFNGTAATTFTVSSDTQMSATVPTGATTGKISVTNTAGTGTSATNYTVIVANLSVAIGPKRGGLTVTQALPFTAAVTNDVGNAGVTWSASSGSFSTQSTTSATFVAPTTAGVVTVTATSVADVTKSASAIIGVTDLAGVFTYHNDLSRDGANTQEYALTPTNVATATFGKLFSCAVDAPVYAQPLWVANLAIGGGTHNVIFVATQHDSVYAFDADASPCMTYWQKQLLPAGETLVNNTDVGSGDIVPDIGITGTPVIDPSTSTLYVVTKSKDIGTACTPTTSCHQRLHAISLVDGSEKFGGPVDITGAITVPGTGDDSSGSPPTVPFNPLRENQRPGLALVNGVVYIAWASHGDQDPYHGWVIGYNASTLTLAPGAVFNTTPNSVSGYLFSRGGIWMSGGALAADSGGNLYFLTGNGSFDADSGGSNYGDSTVKLGTVGGLKVVDWFTPSDQATLDSNDTDHGSGGAALLLDQPSGPVPHLLIGGGKQGNLFLVNRDNMGHFSTSTNNVVQTVPFVDAIFATSAFWSNALYLAGWNGPLKRFVFNPSTGTFNTSLASSSSSSYGFPGATPSISASSTTSNGIVWALDNSQFCTDPTTGCAPAILHAYDASNLGTELWNSTQDTGIPPGNPVKFTVPTIANGKVYFGTRTEIEIYGLLPN